MSNNLTVLSPAAQRSIDIYNIIAQNCSSEALPTIPSGIKDPGIARITFQKVGQVLRGNPAVANEFINQLYNEIFLKRFYQLVGGNKYEVLKKGTSESGNSVQLTFTEISKPVEYNPELGGDRFFKRTKPDVRTAFLTRNYAFYFPITTELESLQLAFADLDGLSELTNSIISAPARGQKYNELLMARYVLCRSVINGALKQVPVTGDTSTPAALGKSLAVAVRSAIENFTLPSTKWNSEGVLTDSSPADAFIVFDTDIRANFDVNVLAPAYNPGNTDLFGNIITDNWKDIDFDNFNGVAEEVLEDMGIVAFTSAEIAILDQVQALVFEREFVQIYDLLHIMKQQEVGPGLYWNYWLHVWQIWGTSPFANGVAIMLSPTRTTPPTTFNVVLNSEGENQFGINTYNYEFVVDGTVSTDWQLHLVQTDALAAEGVAAFRPGSLVVPSGVTVPTSVILAAEEPAGTWTTYEVTLPTTIGGSAAATVKSSGQTYDQVWAATV